MLSIISGNNYKKNNIMQCNAMNQLALENYYTLTMTGKDQSNPSNPLRRGQISPMLKKF